MVMPAAPFSRLSPIRSRIGLIPIPPQIVRNPSASSAIRVPFAAGLEQKAAVTREATAINIEIGKLVTAESAGQPKA